ncbi:MAG: hypothetical protein OEV94_08055 [Deltaproteobacteria bacterium]|nr:hypothetical protein [Deltaproteobacteria bacterium]
MLWVAWVFWLCSGAPAWAQQKTFMRFAIPSYSSMAFDTHPMLQITADTAYSHAYGTSGGPIDFGYATMKGESTLYQILHLIPPIGFEWGQDFDLIFPRGFSIGAEIQSLRLTENQALSGRTAATQGIDMDTYYYIGTVRIFIYPPSEPGLNYFYGFGFGVFDGMFYAAPSGGTTGYYRINSSAIGMTRIGMEYMGERYGFRYEISSVSAPNVHIPSNPFPGGATSVDFSGVILRITLLIQL